MTSVRSDDCSETEDFFAIALLLCSQWDRVRDTVNKSPVSSGAVDYELDRMDRYMRELRRRAITNR